MNLKINPFFILLIPCCLLILPSHTANDNELTVDADFPGGNIIAGKIEGNDIYVRQDLRDTQGDWFYWYFRVRGAAGRDLTVHFTQSKVIGVRGPAYSTDRGKTWNWATRHTYSVDDNLFFFKAHENDDEIRFCFAMPYLESNLREFLKKYNDHLNLKVDTLCESRKGRPVERILLGNLQDNHKHKLLLTCRHHCCEMMASYTLEGFMEAVLEDTQLGQWFQLNTQTVVIPFMDKDGVEDGDQGKNRKPHDHNRDYAAEIYPEVKALKNYVSAWAGDRMRIAIDMHCPWIRGDMNERIYFVCGPDEIQNKRIGVFSFLLENLTFVLTKTGTASLPFQAKNNLPWNQGWNNADNYKQGKSCAGWSKEIPGILFGTSIEIPYANAEGQAVTPETARQFGRDMANVVYQYLKSNSAQ